jgi:hypothetical protein
METLSKAEVHEPEPVKNEHPPCYIEYVARFDGFPKIQADIIARAKQGHLKYGVYLQPFNGRNVKMDIYQELLDAGQYFEQLLQELGRDHLKYPFWYNRSRELRNLIRDISETRPETVL